MSQGRYAIVGTAQSWKRTPWTDTGLTVASLNDAYRLRGQGFARADEWFDFHPLDAYWHPPAGAKGIYAHQVPPGKYVRPSTHLAWLEEQARHMPVWLHPDYRTQHPQAADWTHARAIPKADIEAHFGRYFTSSPGWMLALAILRGYQDIAIYGIHLATEHEYVEQRPNFEFLIGCVLGSGKRAVTVKDGMRHYESATGHIALPEESPVLQSNFQYAFEPRPRAHLEPLKWELHKLQVKQARTISALKHRPWWQPIGSILEPGTDGQPHKRICSTTTLQQELWQIEAELADTQLAIQRVQVTGA